MEKNHIYPPKGIFLVFQMGWMLQDQKNMINCSGRLIVVWLFIWCCFIQKDISFHPTARSPRGVDRANPSTSRAIGRQPNWSRRRTYDPDLPPASQSTPINSHINQLRRNPERSYNNTAINRARERGSWRPAMDDDDVSFASGTSSAFAGEDDSFVNGSSSLGACRSLTSHIKM